MKQYKNIILLLICLIISGFLSIHFGFDKDWDVRNYHIYNPYAFLNSRLEIDIMPASIMTYYNPLMDTFCYLIMQHLNEYPNVILFIFGLSYGLLTFISFKISELVMKTHKRPVLISILATLIGATAINSIYSTGRLAHDLIIAFFGNER